MNNEPTNVEKLRGLPWSVAGNSVNTIFLQFTFFGSVFVLFLSDLDINKSGVGVLLSLLPFSNLVSLFVTPILARYGYKRTFLTFFIVRKFVTALLLLTPLVVTSLGFRAAFYYVAGIVALFSLLRSIAITALMPWSQEYVPNRIRGKYSAMSNIFTTLAGYLAILVAGLVIERSSGLSGYMILIAAGVFAGLIAAWLFSFIPGGAPSDGILQKTERRHELQEPLRDGAFTGYLIGAGLVLLATSPLASFLPLFMKEQVGLSESRVVFLQFGTMTGTLISSFLWGWAADRYGSKPIMLLSVYLYILLPLLWWTMPRGAPLSLYAALGIALLQGIASIGWAIGAGRLLYVGVVPPEKRTGYMAIYTAWTGLVGGFSNIVGGWILDLSHGIAGQISIFPLDSYSPLFLIGLILPVLSIFLLRRVSSEDKVSVGEFVSLFFRGNPFQAVGSMIRYHFAMDERSMVVSAESLGRSRSPLTVEELLESLSDPRFNVRFEAIVSVARMTPDERLMKALVEILHSDEPAFSVIAAWALGRLGDPEGIPPLRKALDSKYRSVKAHSTIALGTLDDKEIVPELLRRLEAELDHGLQVAYASALGMLGAQEATPKLLELLHSNQHDMTQEQLGLALARIVGEEGRYIHLLRQWKMEPGTITSRIMRALKRKLEKRTSKMDPLIMAIDQCEAAFAREDLSGGMPLLCQALEQLSMDDLPEVARLILSTCRKQMHEPLGDNRAHLLLALHVLDVSFA